MIFGSKQEFAIECYPFDLVGGGQPMIQTCVWCAGERLGDIDDPVFLSTEKCDWSRLIQQLPHLNDAYLNSLSDEDAFEFFDAQLFGVVWAHTYPQSAADDDAFLTSLDSKWPPHPQHDPGIWHKFNFLTNWNEQYNGTKAFMITTDDACRILYRRRDDSRGSAWVRRPVVERVIDDFLNWCEQYEHQMQFV